MGVPAKKSANDRAAENINSRPAQANGFLVWQPSVFISISEQIENIGQILCPVIIRGEPGTAKESVARQIHAHSRRADKIFVPVNCAILKGQILEYQLFGHVNNSDGAAASASLGSFRAADCGTLFLDDIDKLNLDTQNKLLHIIRSQSVCPLGSSKQYPIDVRLICGTTADLRQEVHKGKFLGDLYFTLNVASLELPALRQNPQDIVILAKYFLGLHAETYNEPAKRLLPSAIKAITAYSWPGNIRELANVMERAFINSRTAEISASDLPSEVLTSNILPVDNEDFPALEDVDRKLVIKALEKTSGLKTAAAKLLGIDPRRLNRLIKKFDLEVSDYKQQ
ncbi:MAG: sigma 54-interacting transcriptional regulator [Phycisphaerae bacterium]